MLVEWNVDLGSIKKFKANLISEYALDSENLNTNDYILRGFHGLFKKKNTWLSILYFSGSAHNDSGWMCP